MGLPFTVNIFLIECRLLLAAATLWLILQMHFTSHKAVWLESEAMLFGGIGRLSNGREKSFNFFAAFNPSSSSSSGQAWAISCYHRRRCHILPVILALSLSLSSKLSLSLSISHANTFSPSLSHAHNVSLSFTCMLDALSVFLKKASRDCWTPF